MIVRNSLDPKIVIRIGWKRMLTLLLISVSVYAAYFYFGQNVAISTVPAGILGVAIAFLIGFRVNSAYERWWEARKLWGAVVNDSRTFAREVVTFINTGWNTSESPEDTEILKKELIYGQIGFVYALKSHLRREDVAKEIVPYFSPGDHEELSKSSNIPNSILLLQARKIEQAFRRRQTEDFRHIQLDSTLGRLTDSMGGAERIKNTIFPRQYSFYSRFFTRLYSYILPFILVSECGWMTIPFTLIIGFIFFALDSIAGGIENPFQNTFNDIPMSAISRSIEINLREMLKEQDLPLPVEPVNGFLY